MPLFEGPGRGQLDWDAIRALIEAGRPENEMLDYKQYDGKGAPQTIRKTIAAMANTHGGDILLGIDEAGYGKPKPLVTGVPRDAAAKITQQIEGLNWEIHPPVLGLAVQAVDIPSECQAQSAPDHCVVVARVWQSDLVPHFIPGAGHYGRAGSQSHPQKEKQNDTPLSTEAMRWLLDHRAKHEEFREWLLSWMNWLEGGVAWHTVWCVPQFPSPSRHLVESDAASLWEEIPAFKLTSWEHPPLAHFGLLPTECDTRSVQNGCFLRVRDSRARHFCGEHAAPFLTYFVERRGLIAAKALTHPELSAKVTGNGVVESVAFDWQTVALHMLIVSRHAYALYAKAGYGGPVQFGLELGVQNGVAPEAYLAIGEQPYPGHGFGPRSFELTQLGGGAMTAPGRTVREVGHCLSADLLASVRDSLRASDWTSAFDYRFAHTAEGLVRSIESTFADQ